MSFLPRGCSAAGSVGFRLVAHVTYSCGRSCVKWSDPILWLAETVLNACHSSRERLAIPECRTRSKKDTWDEFEKEDGTSLGCNIGDGTP
jgi:hypothetical protein